MTCITDKFSRILLNNDTMHNQGRCEKKFVIELMQKLTMPDLKLKCRLYELLTMIQIDSISYRVQVFCNWKNLEQTILYAQTMQILKSPLYLK